MRDPYRLKFHITPLKGWMNDPNGFTCYKGDYHIFYQAYPYAPESGTKHWAHVMTADFVTYTRLPIALIPDAEYDYQGCYSGSAIEKDDKLYLLYTGHVADKSPKEEQCLAWSEDGIVFEKFVGNPVILHPVGMEEDFRDPYVWQRDGIYYCIVGCKSDDKGSVLLYQSKDLINWDFVNIMLEGTEHDGTMWECPSYTEIGDTAILFLSPENRQNRKHSTLYYTGKLNYKTGKFQVCAEGKTDHGSEFYAPQVINSGERKLLTAWMDNWESEKKSRDNMWCGALIYPREIDIREGKLCLNPIKELEQSERVLFCRTTFCLEAGENGLSQVHSAVFDLNLRILKCEMAGKNLRLCFRTGDNEEMVNLHLTENKVCVEITEYDRCRKNEILFSELVREEFHLRILGDMSSMELFINDGIINATYRFYVQAENCGFRILSDCNIWIQELTVREVRPLEFL